MTEEERTYKRNFYYALKWGLSYPSLLNGEIRDVTHAEKTRPFIDYSGYVDGLKRAKLMMENVDLFLA